MTALIIPLDPDELQGLQAISEVEAAAKDGEADPTATGRALMRAAIDAKLAELGLRWNPSPAAIHRRAAQAAGPSGAVAALMRGNRARRYVTIGLAVAALTVLWGGYSQGWNWTGYQGNTLWDWLGLLLLPVLVPTVLLPTVLRRVAMNAPATKENSTRAQPKAGKQPDWAPRR